MANCPTCDSPHPHLHPAVQTDGEVELCTDAFHEIDTLQNRREYVDAVRRKRAAAKRED